MEVEVGSFSDPEGLEGLAHFLGEFRLLFLGVLQHFDSFGSLRARAGRITIRIHHSCRFVE